MKLSGEQRDELASFVAAQDIAGAISYVESLLSGGTIAEPKPEEDAAAKKKARLGA